MRISIQRVYSILKATQKNNFKKWTFNISLDNDKYYYLNDMIKII